MSGSPKALASQGREDPSTSEVLWDVMWTERG